MTSYLPANDASGLVIQLPEAEGADWHWWLVQDGTIADSGVGNPPDSSGLAIAMVPSALCPVRIEPLGELPLAQAEAAARLRAEARAQPSNSAAFAVAAAQDEALLIALTDRNAMTGWLARMAAEEFDPDVIFPAAALLPARSRAVVGSDSVARNDVLAIAAEPALVEAMGLADLPEIADVNALILSGFSNPPLNLRSGIFARARPAFYQLDRWRTLLRMTAVAALLGLAILLTEIIKLHLDANRQEDVALAETQKRFPAATDLASAENLIRNDLVRRGAGPGSFASPAAAVLAAMQPLPNLTLRDLGYGEGGVLRITAAAPAADDINRLLADLQQSGWLVTVPPNLAPDPTGATVAAITVRAP